MTKEKILEILEEFSDREWINGESKKVILAVYFQDIADAILKQPPSALDLIAQEREKQINKGYTVESDHEYYRHTDITPVHLAIELMNPGWHTHFPNWDHDYWVRLINLPYKDRVRIAAAWHLAELERIEYLENQKETNNG